MKNVNDNDEPDDDEEDLDFGSTNSDEEGESESTSEKEEGNTPPPPRPLEEQTLELNESEFEKPPGDPVKLFKTQKSIIANSPKQYAASGQAFCTTRNYGLWRESIRPKFKSFADFYRFMGYTADQVCNLMAQSALLLALCDQFGKTTKITVFHATVLLSGVRDDKKRFEADTELACDIFATVLKTEKKVTGALLRKELEARGLGKARKPKPSDSGEQQQELDLTSDESNSKPESAPFLSQDLRNDFDSVRNLANDLIDRSDETELASDLRDNLIELQNKLDELWEKLTKA